MPPRRSPLRSPDPRPAPFPGGPIDPHPICLRFSGNLSSFEKAFDELRRALDAGQLTSSARARYNIELVFEEIVGNILRYGAPQGGELHIAAKIHREGERVLATIEDDGIPFDPCAIPSEEIHATLEGTREGGYGLLIVRRASIAMHYQRTDDSRNRLTVTLSALD